LTAAAALVPAPAEAQGFFETDKLVASDPFNDDEFGTSAAVSGNTLVVGSPGSDSPSPGQGLAYVFERDGNGSSVEDAQLSPASASLLAEFGRSVAIDGDTIAVASTESEGEVWVFERDGSGAWNETAQLASADGIAESFGFSLAVVGDTVAVGAPGSPFSLSLPDPEGDVPPGTDAGAVYVFEKDGGGVWQEVAKLVDPEWDTDPMLGREDSLGKAVSMSADRIVAGGPHVNSSDFGEGAVLIYTRDGGGQWGFDERLDSPMALEGFGAAVSISDETIIVGSQGVFDDQVFVYELDEFDVWQETELLPSGVDFRFGRAVDVLGDQAVVSAVDETQGITEGVVYTFERNGAGSWSEIDLLQASDGEDDDDFGNALALGSGVLFVGAWMDDTSPWENSGSVYVFDGGLPPVQLSLAGTCPGTMTLTVDTTDQPNEDVVIFLGRDPGVTVVTGGGCAGTELDLEPARIFRTVTTDGSGVIDLTSVLQDRFCGRLLQGLDRACSTSNLLEIE
jgi:hypothetical protein